MTETERQDYAQLLSQTQERPSLRNLHWSGKKKTGRFFLVTAPPKSGSTWVNNVIGRSLAARRTRYCYAWSSNEHDLYVPALLSLQNQRTTAQMHMKATPHNAQLIIDFAIRTVVLTRNVYDTMASFARDLEKKSKAAFKVPGTIGYSFVWMGNCDPDWSQSDWIDYSIDFYLPWYINFLSSWAALSDKVDAEHIRYEAVFRDQVPEFQKLIRKLDPARDLDMSSLEKDFTQIKISGTKSETGSGRQAMTAEQIQRIHRMFHGLKDDWVRSHLNWDL